MQNEKIKICYLPGRESSYSRNRVLLKAMKDAELTVFDCSSPIKNCFRYVLSFFKFLGCVHKSDAVFVGFLGHFLVPLVKVFTRKKILFDAFISIYQTTVFDRKSFAPNGIPSRLAKFIDRFSCRLADQVFLDTEQHICYFRDTLGLSDVKFSKLIVGSDDSVMYPRDIPLSDDFLVHFHGEYQALHGAGYIVQAAKLLPEIKFQMIGKGKHLAECKRIAEESSSKNISFIDTVPYEKLPRYMVKAHICLGIFGDTQKSRIVVPHKIYEAMALGKPLITADTPAARELLKDRETALFCREADPQSLADAIRTLQSDEPLRKKIAANALNIFKENCTPKVIGEELSSTIKNLLSQTEDQQI